MMKTLHLKQKLSNQVFVIFQTAFILVTGDITVTGGNTNIDTAFKNCTPFFEIQKYYQNKPRFTKVCLKT